MNVLKMNCEGSCILSNAELEAMAWNEVGCHKLKSKYKCDGNCSECTFGQGHLLMNTVDPFQRMVINDRTDRHIMHQMMTPGQFFSKAFDVLVYLFCAVVSVGVFVLIALGIMKAGRYAQWW